jgi:hypothetical protein
MASKTKAPTAAERIESAYQAAMRLAGMVDDVFRAASDGKSRDITATLMSLMEAYGTDCATVFEALKLIPARKDSAAIVCGENMFHALWLLCDTIRLNVVDTPNTSLAEFVRGVRPKLRELELRAYQITDVWGGLMTDRRLALERFTAEREPTARPAKQSPRLTDRQDEIVKVIREAGRRLTQEQVLDKLRAEHDKVSSGTTYNYLAALVRMKVLTNRQDVEPPGYGLPEWHI